MAETPRRFVLENMLVAGHPMIPGDSGFQYELLQGAQPDEGNAAVQYPGIKARLVLPLPESGKPMVRADRLYDVHYHLLALAALGDYETRHVYFTAGGLLREMGWSEGGRQMQLVRDCVDYLWRTTMEFEGMFSDPLLAGMSSEQVRAFRILIGRGYPKMEERRSGRRNMSYVEYHPTYMASIASNPGVQLDVELLSLIPGTLGKAHYRTFSWLRAIGENRIELGEMFERVGSVRQRMTRSDAIRVFSGAWEEMLRYRYLRSKPVFDKRGPGQYELVLDWGDPVVLPHRADLLFRAVTDAGVHSATGEWMIKENRLKLVRVMQAFKAGALGKPQTTPAALIVGAFKKEDWDVDVEEMERRPQGVQTELLPAESPSGFTVERQGPLVVCDEGGAGVVDWDRLLDWAALRGRVGGAGALGAGPGAGGRGGGEPAGGAGDRGHTGGPPAGLREAGVGGDGGRALRGGGVPGERDDADILPAPGAGERGGAGELMGGGAGRRGGEWRQCGRPGTGDPGWARGGGHPASERRWVYRDRGRYPTVQAPAARLLAGTAGEPADTGERTGRRALRRFSGGGEPHGPRDRGTAGADPGSRRSAHRVGVGAGKCGGGRRAGGARPPRASGHAARASPICL